MEETEQTQQTPTTKALSMPELAQRAVMAIVQTMAGTAKEYEWVLDDIYPTYAIVVLDGTFYRVDFAIDGNVVTVPKRRDWVEVTREWVEDKTPSVVFDAPPAAVDAEPPTALSAPFRVGDTLVVGDSPTTLSVAGGERVFTDWNELLRVKGVEPELPTAETLVMEGGFMKFVREDGDIATIRGRLIKFTSPKELDSYGHYFSKDTDLGPMRQTVVWYDHALDETIKARPIGPSGVGTLTLDDEGVWLETQLNLRDKYERQMLTLAQKNKLGLSSGTAPHLAKFSPAPTGNGKHIDLWVLGADASLTVRPAAGPSLTQVMPLKSYTSRPFVKAAAELLDEEEEATSQHVDSHPEAESEQAQPQDGAQAHEEAPPSASAAVPQGVVSGKSQNGEPSSPHTTENLEDMDMGDFTLADITKAVTDGIASATQELRTKVDAIETALASEQPNNDPGHAVRKSANDQTAQAPYVLRFTNPEAALKQVQFEAAGEVDFYKFNHEQSGAFNQAVRDNQQLSGEEARLLKRQVFAPTHLKLLLNEGLSVKQIKDMQQVAQGSLGGYAMPPLMQETIVTALPGRTAFRGNGATVITMTGDSNTYPVNIYKNVNGQYVGTLRGGFSSEKGDPNLANYDLEQVDIRLETYLFKVSKSVRELAIANLQQVLQRDIINTMAMDEDRVFAIGDGVGKPLGVLPGGINTLGLKEVASGHASTLTTGGIKKLKRGVASQYRSRGAFVANSDTYGDLELLTVSGTGSDFAFPSLSENDQLLRRPALESGFMPDVAANAYPLMYAAPEGYYIVEMPGMTIARLQDTNTSVNKVEIHVMKLFGGRLVEPWTVAVQKVAETV